MNIQEHKSSQPQKLHFGPWKSWFEPPGVREPPVGNRCFRPIAFALIVVIPRLGNLISKVW